MERATMSAVSFQTVRLSRGKHSSPEQGACVMELASMLAGEPFSDHPQSVCPVIGALLRSYNDRVDNGQRQLLLDCASHVIGSRASQGVEDARADLLRSIVGARSQGWKRFLTMPQWFLAGPERRPIDVLGHQAATAIIKRSRPTVLELVVELLAIGRDEAQPLPAPTDYVCLARALRSAR
jgi:hypothetical protein